MSRRPTDNRQKKIVAPRGARGGERPVRVTPPRSGPPRPAKPRTPPHSRRDTEP